MEAGYLESMLKRDSKFLGEIWASFGIIAGVIFLRFAVRVRMVGPKGLKGDDYVMFVTLIMYAICAVMVDLVYRYGTNVDLVADQIELLSDEEVARLVNGSKFQQVAWYSYTAYLWSLKVALLFFYSRMTFALWQHERVLTYLTWFTVASYLAMVGTITFSCRPFSDNWGVRPLPHDRCVFKAQNLVVTTLLNVLTDAAILSLPLPVLKEIRVPMYKKVFIAALLCSGLFVMAASIMRVAATMGSEPSTLTVNRWGVRECEIGLVAINAPILRPLFSRRFWQWNYRPSMRNTNPMVSARRSKTTIGQRRRLAPFQDEPLFEWMNSMRPNAESGLRSRNRGSLSQVEAEVETVNEGEIEPLNETEEEVVHEQERYRDVVEEEEERG